MAIYHPRTEKKLFKNVNYTKASSLPNPLEYCAQRKRQDGQVYQAKLRVSIPTSNTTLCVTLLNTRRTNVDHQQTKIACPSPYSSKRIFLTHLQMDIMDLRNSPCACSCHRKHTVNRILHMINHFTKYSWLYPLKNKQAEHVLECLSQFCWQFGSPQKIQNGNGREFKNSLMSQFCKNNGITRQPHGAP